MNDACEGTPERERSDAELVKGCRSRAPGAWEALVRRFERLIYTIPRRAGLDEHAASDVFQNVFLRLYENLGALQEPGRVQAWLVTTARRETLRYLQQRQRFPSALVGSDAGAEHGDDRPGAEPLLVAEDPLPEDLLADLQMRHRVRLALDALGEPCAGLLKLLYLAEDPVPYADISRQLAMPVGSIGPTRARCLTKLRDRLGA